MATLSKGIQLAYKAAEASEFTTLTNLQEIPELGSSTTRERIDITTLDDDKKKSMAGLQEEGETELSFTFLYEKAQFNTLNGLEGNVEWKVTLPDSMTATFSGVPSVRLAGAGVSAALTYTLGISVEGDIVFA